MKLNDLIQSAKGKSSKTVVVPFAHDPYNINCISQAIQDRIARFILIGEEDKIRNSAQENNADISGAEFIEETDETAACDKAACLVRDGEAHVMIKGMVQSSTFIRSILRKDHKLIQPDRIISCASLFELPAYHKLLLITDTAVNIKPSLEFKINILQNAIDISRKLGIECPKVACVESVEKINLKIPGTVEAEKLSKMGQDGFFGNADIDGPLGFDVAISTKAAEAKGIASSVAGDPDIILLPELVTANVLYKSFVWCGNGKAASIVAGAEAPIVLTSRSDSEEIKLLSIALSVFLA